MDQGTHQAETATVDGGGSNRAADSEVRLDPMAVDQSWGAEQKSAVLDIQRPPARTDPLGDLPAPEPGPPQDPTIAESIRWRDAVAPPRPLADAEWFRSRSVGDSDQVVLLGSDRAVFTPDDDTGRAANIRASDEVARAFGISAAPDQFADGEPAARVFGEVAEARLTNDGQAVDGVVSRIDASYHYGPPTSDSSHTVARELTSAHHFVTGRAGTEPGDDHSVAGFPVAPDANSTLVSNEVAYVRGPFSADSMAVLDAVDRSALGDGLRAHLPEPAVEGALDRFDAIRTHRGLTEGAMEAWPGTVIPAIDESRLP